MILWVFSSIVQLLIKTRMKCEKVTVVNLNFIKSLMRNFIASVYPSIQCVAECADAHLETLSLFLNMSVNIGY
jgi:hypothetical protein